MSWRVRGSAGPCREQSRLSGTGTPLSLGVLAVTRAGMNPDLCKMILLVSAGGMDAGKISLGA